MLLSLLLACPPKAPPEGSVPLAATQVQREPAAEVVVAPGSTELKRPDDITGLRALALGSALPWEGLPETAPQQAFLDGEAVLATMLERADALDHRAQRAEADRAGEQAELALGHFQIASQDPRLAAPSAARAGDAWRLAAQAILEMQPPADLLPDAFREYQRQVQEAAEPLVVFAEASYTRVVEDITADPRWVAHARWGLEELR